MRVTIYYHDGTTKIEEAIEADISDRDIFGKTLSLYQTGAPAPFYENLNRFCMSGVYKVEVLL